jgi:Tfp pilus assembly protein PilN
MTATEKKTEAPATNASSPLRRMLVFGTGLGIALTAKNLEAVVVRSRPSGPTVTSATTIRDFRARPAAEWGAELTTFVEAAREKRLAATVLLPRDEAIVRTVHLPGVAEKDIPGAIELQIDTLHPFGDEEVAWASQVVGRGQYVVGIVRKALLNSYETLFTEAGIPVAAFSFSSAAIHAALRIWSAAPASLFVLWTPDARPEIYGESEARPFYSAEYPTTPERALSLSRGELRLPHDYAAQSLTEALPAAGGVKDDYSPAAYAAALVGSAPLVTRFANLLPKERRASSARRQFLLPVSLGALLAGGLIAVFVVMPAMEQRNYLAALNAEIRRLEPAAQQAQAMEKRAAANRARTTALDEIRRRPQADLDVLNELTRLLPSQVWTNSIEIFPDSVVLAGEADQAAPLLKLLDSSPLFQNSEFALSVTRNAQSEQFRIKTMRRGRTGRTTP